MHVMIDFETFATTPNAKVLSLGAVFCGRDANGEIMTEEKEWFFIPYGQESRFEDPATVAWWKKQSAEAQKIFQTCNERGVGLGFFAAEFADWFESFGSDVRIWGNGALFDIAIMNNIMDQFKIKKPWKYSNEMCYRTLSKMCGVGYGKKFNGTKHNALHDARFQMQCLQEWLGSKT